MNLCKIAFKTLYRCQVTNSEGGFSEVIGNEWVKSEEEQLTVMYIQFSLRHFKILSAHQSFFFFSNDNKLKYCLRRKQSYLFIHFDLLSLAIDGFVHLIFCKRVGRP